MLRKLRPVWIATLITLYVSLAWIAGLLVLAWWLIDAVATFRRERLAVAPSIRCGRGHDVPQWGAFRCPCGAVYEGSVWDCPVCGAGGLVECPTCGLTVSNPRFT